MQIIPPQVGMGMTTTTPMSVMKTPMELSGNSSSGSSDRRSNTYTRLFGTRSTSMGEGSVAGEAPEELLSPEIVYSNEPYLYGIPKTLNPTYGSVPLPIKLLSLVLSIWASALSTWKNLTWFQPLAVLSGMRLQPSVKEWISFAVKTLALALSSQVIIQDIFLKPSRISTSTLQSKYWLPSPLSKYEQIPIAASDNNTASSLGVHYLKYDNPTTSSSHKFDALYVLHGFGASSLSWLPPLPLLVERLNAKVGLGHDAVGFGFTDRQLSSSSSNSGDNNKCNTQASDLALYTNSGSAMIGTQILKKTILGVGEGETSSDQQKNKKLDSVIIMGHSLGGITALKMALQLPKETSKTIILSAPALGLRPRPKTKSNSRIMKGGFPIAVPWINRKVLHPMGSFLRNTLIYPTGGYVLRRVVGGKKFWKNGLKMVWGDPKKVSDSDALRFQWPSIGSGWERGLLEFARAQGSSSSGGTIFASEEDDDDDDDVTLLRKVLDLPDTTVAVILGSKDKVIPTSMSLQFFKKNFPNKEIPIITLDGCGHDAFEEDIETFIDAAEQTVNKNSS